MNDSGCIVELIMPPPWNALGKPHLALPLLKRFLEKHQFPTKIYDVNQMLLRDFFTQEHMRRVREELTYRLLVCQEENLADSDLFREMFVASEIAAYAIPRLKEIQGNLVTDTTTEDRMTLQLCARAISALFYPTLWSLRHSSYETRHTHKARTLENAFLSVKDRHGNIFAPYLEQRVIPQLSRVANKVVGISLVTESQLVPALTMARLLKQRHPETCVVLGGTAAPCLWDAVASCNEFYDWVDALVVGPGEWPLLEITKRHSCAKSLVGLPNVKVRSRTGQVVGTRTTVEPTGMGAQDDLDADWTDLVDNEYGLKYPGLPIRLSSRCYWNQCTFCSRANAQHVSYQIKAIETVVRDLEESAVQYGITHFDFVDESIPLKFVERLATAILDQGLELTWQCLCRFDPGTETANMQLIRDAGCLYIRWGLESGSPSVLARMKKGIDTGTAHKVLTKSHAAGIWNHLFVIVGFPGETHADFEETLRFLRESAEYVDSVGISGYLVERYSEVAHDPGRFGLVIGDQDERGLYTKVIRPEGGMVSRTEVSSRRRALLETVANTHIFANFVDPVPSATILSRLKEHGKASVRAQMESTALEWCRRRSNADGDAFVQLSQKVHIGRSSTLEIGETASRFCLLIQPRNHKAYLLPRRLVQQLKVGIPVEGLEAAYPDELALACQANHFEGTTVVHDLLQNGFLEFSNPI